MMRPPDPILLRLYRRATVLYPASFRNQYREQSIVTARDWYREAALKRGSLAIFSQLAGDFLISLFEQHWFVLRRQLMKYALVFHTVALVFAFTLLGGVAAITMQQMLRRGANEPQQQMVESYSIKIASGTSPSEAIPAGHIDISQSLEPFLIFYDNFGSPIHSNGFLDAAPPVPPAGVFDRMRRTGSDTLTWQPRPGVRIAMVARRVKGANPGFLLAGRSLRVVEEYESQLRRIVLIGWLIVISLLTGGAALLVSTSRSQTAVRI